MCTGTGTGETESSFHENNVKAVVEKTAQKVKDQDSNYEAAEREKVEPRDESAQESQNRDIIHDDTASIIDDP